MVYRGQSRPHKRVGSTQLTKSYLTKDLHCRWQLQSPAVIVFFFQLKPPLYQGRLAFGNHKRIGSALLVQSYLTKDLHCCWQLGSALLGGGDIRVVAELSFAYVTTKTWAYSVVFGFYKRKKIYVR